MAGSTGNETAMNAKNGSVIISYEDFRDLISRRGAALLRISNTLADFHEGKQTLIRPLLGAMLSESTQLEELLDSYGAQNNERWRPFRLLIAAIKLFSDVSYVLLHIQHALPAYRLLPIEHDFVKATEDCMNFTAHILLRSAKRLIRQAQILGLEIPPKDRREMLYKEDVLPGRLPHDRENTVTETVEQTVTLLATAFLNQATESKLAHPTESMLSGESRVKNPERISVKYLRQLEMQFHNLQTLYDTHVSETTTEGLDPDLPILRGHVSVIYHLLEVSTRFSHYYERHVKKHEKLLSLDGEPLVTAEELLSKLLFYAIHFASHYLTCAQKLCQNMLKRYAETGQVTVKVPQYRGFHVRPSTLIAKLVLHYGSNVTMELEGEKYNSAMPLELFRANEKINAQKRRWLAAEIVRTEQVDEGQVVFRPFRETLHKVLMSMAEQKKLIMYEQPIELPENPSLDSATLLEQVLGEIAKLLATGKIDIFTDLTVRFVGDKRVLEDIKLLAENGYGEDKFGNNIELPEALTYLRG